MEEKDPFITTKDKRKRLREILHILRKYEVIRNFLRQKDPGAVRQAFEELGPTFIKAGQLLSTRPDLISPSFIHEFRKLQDNALTDPFASVKATFEQECGQKLTAVFASFEEVPFASGSMAQTHQATLKDGTKVVVKVQHPHIKELIETDLSLFKQALKILKFVPDMSVVDPKEILQELKRSLLNELDTSVELKNSIEFYRLNDQQDIIEVPKVYPKYSAQKILVEEAMPGQSIKHLVTPLASDPKKRAKEQAMRTYLAQVLVKNFIKQVFIDNFFHADPHPGNLLFYELDAKKTSRYQTTKHYQKELGNVSMEMTRSKRLPPYRLVYLDFGMMGRLTKNMADGIAKIVIALNTKDTYAIGKAVLAVCSRTGVVDEEEFYTQLGIFLTPYLELGLGQIDLSALLFEVVSLCRKNNLQLRSEVTLLVKAFASLEGVVAALDPTLSLLEVARPFAKEYFKQNFDAKQALEDLTFEAYRAFKVAPKLPVKLEHLLDDSLNGNSRLNLKLKGQKELLDRLETLVNRLVLAIILAALIMGSSLLVEGSEKHPAIYNIGVIGYLLAALIVLFLLLSEVHRRFKKK